MKESQRFKYLFDQYSSKKYTVEEKLELMKCIDSNVYDDELKQLIGDKWQDDISDSIIENKQSDELYRKIIHHVKRRKATLWWRYPAAAAAILFFIAGGYFLLPGKKNKDNLRQNTVAKVKDIQAPKSARATIMLANGKQIMLDSAGNGILATQGNVSLIKNGDGQITYSGTNNKTEYNTLTNPRGSKVVNIVLADGSKVWLNTESSLRYPTAFAGRSRDVELIGEGYFEVSKNAAMPFTVQVSDMKVQVLGTHFNINSYTNEATIKTTLFEGSVKVYKGSLVGLLKPGQQAQVTSGIKIINEIDIDEVMAWKNGLFNFDNADLQTVLRQLSRWYDVDIVYESTVPKRSFGGEMQRDLNLSEVLKILEKNQVHFLIEGNKIIVKP